jgi:hypothetical protein
VDCARAEGVSCSVFGSGVDHRRFIGGGGVRIESGVRRVRSWT